MRPHIDFTRSNYFGNLSYWIFLRQSLVLFLVFKEAYSQRICRLFIVPKSTSATNKRASRWVVTEQRLDAIQPSLILLFTLVLSWHVKMSAPKKKENTYQGTLTSLLFPRLSRLKANCEESSLCAVVCSESHAFLLASVCCAEKRRGQEGPLSLQVSPASQVMRVTWHHSVTFWVCFFFHAQPNTPMRRRCNAN